MPSVQAFEKTFPAIRPVYSTEQFTYDSKQGILYADGETLTGGYNHGIPHRSSAFYVRSHHTGTVKYFYVYQVDRVCGKKVGWVYKDATSDLLIVVRNR